MPVEFGGASGGDAATFEGPRAPPVNVPRDLHAQYTGGGAMSCRRFYYDPVSGDVDDGEYRAWSRGEIEGLIAKAKREPHGEYYYYYYGAVDQYY